MNKKYDAIVVLSGGNNEATSLRIDKALELYRCCKDAKLVLNGFFENIHEDPRLKNYLEDIEQIHPYVLDAPDTEANAYATKIFSRKHRPKNIVIVSSETHLPRVKMIYHKFFKNYSDLDFISTEEPSEKIRRKRKTKEILSNIMTYAEFYGLPRGNGPGTDRTIYQAAEQRKRKLDKFNGLVKKILK